MLMDCMLLELLMGCVFITEQVIDCGNSRVNAQYDCGNKLISFICFSLYLLPSESTYASQSAVRRPHKY